MSQRNIGDDGDFVFSATTYSLSHISSILSSLTAVSSQVLVTIDEDGLNFITEYSHICRGMCLSDFVKKGTH